MKRLLLILAVALLAAGCATGPAPRSGLPAPSQTNQNASGQTQPLPNQQAPVYSGNGASAGANSSGPSNGAGNGGFGGQTNGQTNEQSGSGAAGGSANASAGTPAPPRTAAQASSPAVMSLLDRADTLAKNGNMEDAAATLERALDLAPRNPFVYQRLAAVRLAAGQAGQAEQIARKSNSVAGNNPFVEADNWLLIAEARKTAGDARGEQAARAQAVNYRQSASRYGQ